jgi:hypothetical protein
VETNKLSKTPQAIALAVKNWDHEKIEDLMDLLIQLKDACGEDRNSEAYLDFTSLPSEDIPADVDTSFPVWAMDKRGVLLTGSSCDDTMTIEEYRELGDLARFA